MKSRRVCLSAFLFFLLFAASVFAQQKPARDFDAEIRAAVESAKTAAGFEFLGTLARICLLPQSGGENTDDTGHAFRFALIGQRWWLDRAFGPQTRSSE